jgi:uncharacterized damage-inducible protein DinB
MTSASASLLTDGFERVREAVYDAVLGLAPEELAFRPYPDGNSVAWLIWHLTRIQDDHVAGVAQTKQVWESGDWAPKFGLESGSMDTGYGHTPKQVAAITVKSGETLTAYYDAVHERTIRYVRTLIDDDLSRIVDTYWDPPVTLGVRLVSVINDDLQHAGQAAYLHGMIAAS